MNTTISNAIESTIPVIDKLAEKTQQLANQGTEMAHDLKDKAQQNINHATQATAQYVADQPFKAIVIAAAVGAGVALLMSSRIGHRN